MTAVERVWAIYEGATRACGDCVAVSISEAPDGAEVLATLAAHDRRVLIVARDDGLTLSLWSDDGYEPGPVLDADRALAWLARKDA